MFNDCLEAWSNATGTVSFAQSHNDFFNCGASKGGTGAKIADPQMIGPETTPIPTLPTSHFAGRWTQGAKLWDWTGEYQPIIDRFRTQNAALVNTGRGRLDLVLVRPATSGRTSSSVPSRRAPGVRRKRAKLR